jgi:MmyB-like transcription regulator ligand binding domain
MLPKNAGSEPGISVCCGTPTRPTAPPGARDADRGLRRRAVADALQHRVDALAAGELADALDGRLAALRDDVSRAESRASAMRSSWRPMMMICSAPSRLAAMTAHRPRHDVRFHISGVKHFHHAQVGDLELNYERLEVVFDTDLIIFTYTADPGTRSAEAFSLLGTLAATSAAEQRAPAS